MGIKWIHHQKTTQIENPNIDTIKAESLTRIHNTKVQERVRSQIKTPKPVITRIEVKAVLVEEKTKAKEGTLLP